VDLLTHLECVALEEVVTGENAAVHNAEILEELVVVALGLPLLAGDQDDPLPLHLHVRGDHVQITLQSISVLLLVAML
jgi:hypothetical protein